MLCSLDKNFNVSDNKKKIQGVIQFYSFTKYSVDVLDQMPRKYFMKSSFGLWLVHIFLTARGPCPLLSLLVNRTRTGCTPCKPMLAKSHLILANIKQILIHFVYMRDQEKTMKAANIYLGIFSLYRPKSSQMDFIMED